MWPGRPRYSRSSSEVAGAMVVTERKMADRRMGGKADRRIGGALALALLTAYGSPLTGQVWQPISMAGIQRVAGKVDSVFIDRKAPEFTVGGGDWVSYLAA